MDPTVYQLNLRSAGMFSNVNEVVQQLHLAEQGDYRFHIDWKHSCYFEASRGPNPWRYYFEPCFALDDVVDIDATHGASNKSGARLSGLPGGRRVACTKDNVITPRIEDGNCVPLLMPKDRARPGEIIARYIRLNDEVQTVVNRELCKLDSGYTIGLHIRGLGRNHGGARAIFRQDGKSTADIDYERYFRYVDKRLERHPEAKLFACSDSEVVIDKVLERYGERVNSYEASRSPFGEMHAGHANNAGLEFSPYKLGLDVVVEAYVLAATDYFVHGNSNVANFVVCRRPQIEATYVYQETSDRLIASAVAATD